MEQRPSVVWVIFRIYGCCFSIFRLCKHGISQRRLLRHINHLKLFLILILIKDVKDGGLYLHIYSFISFLVHF